MFEHAKLLDCKIRAFPSYVAWRGLNRQPPNLILIDLDLLRFTSKSALDRALNKTLKNIEEKLDNAHPTVMWSGGGYHIIQPTKAFLLEDYDVFESFENPSRKFVQFTGQFLSNKKNDPCHVVTISFKNCMLRIPGSNNSKYVEFNDKGEIVKIPPESEVKIVQRWDGRRPAINWLLRDFRRYLIQEKINYTFKDAKLRRRRSAYHTTTTNRSISWIESLLQTSIEDYRKFVMWRILAPYLINIKKLSYDQAFTVIKDWLKECGKMLSLDFNANNRIKDNLKATMKGRYLPISLNNLKVENRELFTRITKS